MALSAENYIPEELGILARLDAAVRQADARAAIDSIAKRVEARRAAAAGSLLAWQPVPPEPIEAASLIRSA